MLALNNEQNRLHQQALTLSQRHRELEGQIIEILQKVEASKLYRCLNKPSLFSYTVEVLGFSEAVAYSFITVSRKALAVPELKAAITLQKLSVSKAARIASSLNAENASDWIEFASCHSSREIDQEVVRRNPKAASPDKAKPITEDTVQLTFAVSKETLKRLIRAQSLRAQRQKSTAYGEVLAEALDFYLSHKDPVRKAERAKTKEAKKSLCSSRVAGRKASPLGQRTKLTAAEKNAVFLRDGGRCTHVDIHGKRCGSDRWIDVHHIVQVSQGGSNDPENLTTLCSFHHDLVHQLALPLEGQVTWLRAPERAYSHSIKKSLQANIVEIDGTHIA